MTNQDRQVLDAWAREDGYNDFDTFIRLGGSVIEAADGLGRKIEELQRTRDALSRWTPGAIDPEATEPEKAAEVSTGAVEGA